MVLVRREFLFSRFRFKCVYDGNVFIAKGFFFLGRKFYKWGIFGLNYSYESLILNEGFRVIFFTGFVLREIVDFFVRSF